MLRLKPGVEDRIYCCCPQEYRVQSTEYRVQGIFAGLMLTVRPAQDCTDLPRELSGLQVRLERKERKERVETDHPSHC